jgi:hypothetical protein
LKSGGGGVVLALERLQPLLAGGLDLLLRRGGIRSDKRERGAQEQREHTGRARWLVGHLQDGATGKNEYSLFRPS